MDLLLAGLAIAVVIWMYFQHNPMKHGSRFLWRRFVNWFPLGMSYAFLYMGRYNLNVTKNALGSAISNEQFGWIFGIGTIVYGCSFLFTGPLVDKIGGKRGIIISAVGASLANILMGVATYLYLYNRLPMNLAVTLTVLYALNMFFQSYGGVSIIKVKAYWFHVRERGIFGAIFGTLISVGIYLAFGWGPAIADAAKSKITGAPTTLQRIFQVVFATDTKPVDSTWLVFFVPAILLIGWALIDVFLIKDTPGEAGFEDFDTHDASSGEMDREFTAVDLLKRVFTSPVLLTIAAIEFTGGVIRNGIMQWYFIFAKQVPQPGAEYFLKHWGILLCYSGILGSFAAGYISDKYFHSRRGPPVAIMNGLMLVMMIVMSAVLLTSPFTVGLICIMITFAVIGVHGSMSGTAAADFGGRKATATASGITDGFVYLGSGLQSIVVGHLVNKSWEFWPLFIVPFTAIGLYLAIRMWVALPAATRRYLLTVERVQITTESETIEAEVDTVQVLE